MTSAIASPATPFAFSLKRHIHQIAHRLWCEVVASDVATAPIYVFPDAVRFDAEDVGQLAAGNMAGTLKLPHPHCIFEVRSPAHPGACLASYARATAVGVDSFLFRFDPERRRWTDLLTAVEFLPDGYAEAIAHPDLRDPKDYEPHFETATSMVWRALGLLSIPTFFAEHQLSRLRRPPLAKAGVRGWTYHVADIQPGVVAAALTARRGTHASPRWHIRRGHWRQLADGRRVFVRECQVGDAARGGVVKDYQVQLSEAA